MQKVIYNPHIAPVLEQADKDNGQGYSANLPHTGYVVVLPDNETKMLYEVKNIENVRVVFIRYIHYKNMKSLLDLLSFAVQWWANLRPDMIYMREKERKGAAGKFIKGLKGFNEHQIANNLKQFNCNIDGMPCQCKVYEYTCYNIADKAGK